MIRREPHQKLQFLAIRANANYSLEECASRNVCETSECELSKRDIEHHHECETGGKTERDEICMFAGGCLGQ